MARRLRIAGAIVAGTMFSTPAMEAVFNYSKGIPRLINTICENALLAGYAKHSATVTSEIIDNVARDLRLGTLMSERKNNDEAILSKEQEEKDLLLAMKTLLDLHERLQRSSETRAR
jgi:general secretion pathway protein A